MNFAGQNLSGADFSGDNYYSYAADLSSANLRHANLTNVRFGNVTLDNADLTGADARGAGALELPASAVTANFIHPDGHMAGLRLVAGASLIVRDHDGDPTAFQPTGPLPIVVDQHLMMDATAALRLIFEADSWDSTISFAPGISVTRGGTLELNFAPDVDLMGELGRTIDLFDWTGITPTGSFTISSPYAWDASRLYTTGEVTLVAVPEPGAGLLILVGAVLLAGRARQRRHTSRHV